MIEGQFGNLNELTVVDPADLLPTEMIQTQLAISSLLDEEGFTQKTDDDIEEFSVEETTKEITVEEVK